MKKLKIRVEPDTENVPAVRLSARDASGTSGQIIRWRLRKSDGYVFHSFSGDPEFTGDGIEDKRIFRTFSPPAEHPANTIYEYTITIKKGDEEHNTDAPVAVPNGGKAVIRN